MRACSRRAIRLLGAVCAACLSVTLLANAATANPSSDAANRSAAVAAVRRVTATERSLAPWNFSYYTSGNNWVTTGPGGWASGYLPGELWASYALSGDGWFRDHAATRQAPLGRSLPTSDSVDIGIRYFYSYVRGYQLTANPAYRTIVLKAATAQAQRFNPVVGATRSTAATDSCEVIVDDMMNIQLLRWAADNGGSPAWRDMAHRHALTTARDFVRADGSTYHIVSYDPLTGAIESTGTRQGLSDDSMWARGQAWAIYGFTAEYRASRDATMLATARKVADRYIADLPADKVPYWDFRDPDIPLAPRDSSAAAIAASGLLDLATIDPDPANRMRYASVARDTLASLESTSYFSAGPNPAVLLHGTMNHQSAWTIDVGQSFGDYFFLESLLRLRSLPTTEPALPIHRKFASSGKARYAVDGLLATSCVSKGKQWLDLDLGKRRPVHAVGFAVRYGTSRSAPLKVYASPDRKHWRLILRARSSGQTAGIENYLCTPTSTRYLRFALSGTSRSAVNGVCEIRAY